MKQIRLLFSGPYLGFFVCGGKLRLREQTPQTFTGISRIQTGFLVKHYVRKKKLFSWRGQLPAPPLCTALDALEVAAGAGASILAKFVLFEYNHVVIVTESQYRESDFYDLG